MVQLGSFKVPLQIAMVMTATVTIGQTPMVKAPQHLGLLLVKRHKRMMTGPIIPITMDVVPLDNPFTALNNKEP